MNLLLVHKRGAPRKNDDIKGQNVAHENDSRTLKIKMYADDATLFLRDMMDFREVLSRIKMFSKFSGLTLNKQKSAAHSFTFHFKI